MGSERTILTDNFRLSADCRRWMSKEFWDAVISVKNDSNILRFRRRQGQKRLSTYVYDRRKRTCTLRQRKRSRDQRGSLPLNCDRLLAGYQGTSEAVPHPILNLSGDRRALAHGPPLRLSPDEGLTTTDNLTMTANVSSSELELEWITAILDGKEEFPNIAAATKHQSLKRKHANEILEQSIATHKHSEDITALEDYRKQSRNFQLRKKYLLNHLMTSRGFYESDIECSLCSDTSWQDEHLEPFLAVQADRTEFEHRGELLSNEHQPKGIMAPKSYDCKHHARGNDSWRSFFLTADEETYNPYEQISPTFDNEELSLPSMTRLNVLGKRMASGVHEHTEDLSSSAMVSILRSTVREPPRTIANTLLNHKLQEGKEKQNFPLQQLALNKEGISLESHTEESVKHVTNFEGISLKTYTEESVKPMMNFEIHAEPSELENDQEAGGVVPLVTYGDILMPSPIGYDEAGEVVPLVTYGDVLMPSPIGYDEDTISSVGYNEQPDVPATRLERENCQISLPPQETLTQTTCFGHVQTGSQGEIASTTSYDPRVFSSTVVDDLIRPNAYSGELLSTTRYDYSASFFDILTSTAKYDDQQRAPHGDKSLQSATANDGSVPIFDQTIVSPINYDFKKQGKPAPLTTTTIEKRVFPHQINDSRLLEIRSAKETEDYTGISLSVRKMANLLNGQALSAIDNKKGYPSLATDPNHGKMTLNDGTKPDRLVTDRTEMPLLTKKPTRLYLANQMGTPSVPCSSVASMELCFDSKTALPTINEQTPVSSITNKHQKRVHNLPVGSTATVHENKGKILIDEIDRSGNQLPTTPVTNQQPTISKNTYVDRRIPLLENERPKPITDSAQRLVQAKNNMGKEAAISLETVPSPTADRDRKKAVSALHQTGHAYKGISEQVKKNSKKSYPRYYDVASGEDPFRMRINEKKITIL
ncbi:uncharacterized protein LOC111254849 [Varroa destructor]|uniref:Uncharacterized protein n=1 Tax=Varroa destructor TaxID=109461 RepID=A0A7M7MF24_VARDE|nr:uncharacterized protein LOC111254849 [Varroa destructor]